MLKREPRFLNEKSFFLPLLIIFVLVGSVGSANGAVQSTYYPSDYAISNGAYLSGSVSESVHGVDSDYFVVGSSPSAISVATYNPSAYNLFGNTSYVSGTTGDLVSDNDVYVTFRSRVDYVQSLYPHQESTIIGGVTYNLSKLSSADDAGTTLSADAGTTTGRKLMGKFVYTLTGVSSIPTSTWTIYYRTYKGHPTIDAHCDVDILIRMSNGTVRTTIATDVANSSALTGSWSTVSGTYSWAAYTVVDQTDYLEFDYYIEVTSVKAGYFVYLRIDDNTLAVADQTSATNIYLLPAMEIEFTGSSNMYNWNQLVWSVDSAWTTDNVTVTLQLFNYTLGAYQTSGNGFIAYTSSATANTDETETQTIITNPQHFRDAAGNWKIKVKAVKNTTTQFDFKVDWFKFEPTYWSEYTVSTEFLFSSMATNTATHLNFTVVSQCNMTDVDVTIQIWNYSASVYATSGQAYLKYTSSRTNETKLLSINTNPQFYTSNGNAKIKITGLLAITQYQQEVNQVKLTVSTQTLSQPFNWFTTLLYVLPFVFGLLFLFALKLKRKKKTVSPKPKRPPEGSSDQSKPEKPDIAKKTDAFSGQFGMTHEQIKGQKMLLEIDPASSYHTSLLSFVSEAKNNNESLFIFTNKNSTLHSTLSGVEKVNFRLLTSKTSSPQQINDKETLLPANDLSVLLHAFDGTQREDEKPVNVLFDNLSDIILICGFEKTYKFIRLLLETISSPKATVLFVFNPTAHDQTISSSIRGLFKSQLVYAKSDRARISVGF